MSRVKRLIQAYSRYIEIPWREDAAAAQRVIFCVYPESEELRLRARIDEFELVTRQAKHEWAVFDLTDSFPQWLSTQRYAKSYFQQPHLLSAVLQRYQDFIVSEFSNFLQARAFGEGYVIAVKGVGSLFGFLKVRDVVEKLAPLVKGRLLVFFPGSYENNNYRLLDGYDGWNYLAIPITADKDF